MGGLSIAPAFAQPDNHGKQMSNRARADDHNRNDRRLQRPAPRPSYQHPYRYDQPVYRPRSSYYYAEPRPAISVQSPGISLFFPLDLR
jgi:hypothetical protein